MSSNVAHRFTLGSLTDVQLGIQLLKDYSEPIAPTTRDKAVVIPGRDGEYDFGADLGARLFKLKCEVVDAATQEELQTKIRALAAHLVDNEGKPCDLALSFDKEPGKSYTVRLQGALDIKRIIAHGIFTLGLYAADPFAYGAEAEVEETVTTSPGEIAVTNDGTVSTPLVITIKNNGVGTISGFELTLT